MRVQVVDPSAFTPPYDHALCGALARAGAEVELVTSRFPYGPVPAGDGSRVREFFYRLAFGRPGSRVRAGVKAAQHVPDMLRYRRYARAAGVVHFQWFDVENLDVRLTPRSRPLVYTAHNPVPKERRPGGLRAQRELCARADAVVVHSDHGRGLVERLGIDRARIRVIPHGAFDHLLRQPVQQPLPAELAGVRGPVVLFFGLIRPYKGLDVLLEAWRGIEGAELWVVGMPRMDIEPLRRSSPPGVRWVPRFVTDQEIPAFMRRAELVVLPYRAIDQSGVLYTALAFGRPLVLSAVGGFPEVAATGAAQLVEPGDPAALHAALAELLADEGRRASLAAAARAAAEGPYSWDRIAGRTLDLYREIAG